MLPAVLTGLGVAAAEPALNEAKVFEWWDDGIIDGDEAREILDQLETGNTQEACLLATVYALESCEEESAPATAAREPGIAPRLMPHGYAEWQGRTDSLGHLESHRTELRVNFYRYHLRLGTQSLLTYRSEEATAHFGEISTKELYSPVPLDTLWGTALFYTASFPAGRLRLGALLDTAATTRASAAFIPARGTEIEAVYWHTVEAAEEHSIALQGKSQWMNLAAWWKGTNPLLKIQLRYHEKTEIAKFSWKADAYWHGDSLPRQANLSATVEKTRFWGSQTVTTTFRDSWKSRASANARIMMPLEGDSTKARFKVTAETGPAALRGGGSATCLEAASGRSRCRQNDLALKLRSVLLGMADGGGGAEGGIDGVWSITAAMQMRHTRGQGFGDPRTEAGITYRADTQNHVGAAAVFPKGKPDRELRIRSEADVGTPILRLSLAVTFRRTAETPLHPLHGHLKMRMNF